ncbi:GroES-like protein [Russula compacta]|nr:GroES-like protein [Russula compacta]
MSHTIPRTQKAALVVSADAPIVVKDDYPVKQPEELAPGECLIRMHCTGVCHTDLHARKGDWPLAHKLPLIGGHEGVGDIVALGAHTVNSPVKIGDRVGVKWLADSCLHCEQCRKGLEQTAPRRTQRIHVDGTSQYVVSYVSHVTPIPENLSSQEAASFLCAGVTVYRALKYGQTKPGDWIVLPGAGGGLGHLAVQYAVHAFGLRVVAVGQHGKEKRELCLNLGAEKWVDFRESKDLVKDIKDAAGGDGPHAALVAAASSPAYEQAIDYLRPGGSLLVVGLPANAQIGASVFWTVVKSINIIGSYVGNRQDAREALDIASMGKIRCHLHLSRCRSYLSTVYEGLEQGTVVGRVVLNME